MNIIKTVKTWTEPAGEDGVDFKENLELIDELKEMIEASEENVKVLNDVNTSKREGGGEGEGGEEGEDGSTTTIGFGGGGGAAAADVNPFASATLNTAPAATTAVPTMMVAKKKKKRVEVENVEANKKAKTKDA